MEDWVMTRLTNLLDSGISLDLCLLMEPTWVRVKMDNMLSSNGIKTLTTKEQSIRSGIFRSPCASNPNFQKIQPGSKKTHSLITNQQPNHTRTQKSIKQTIILGED
jgi:hypothetical protein